MANYKTSWVQRLIDGVWQKTFAFAHTKTVYTDYANKKTLADKLSEIDTEIGNKANKTEIPTELPANGGNSATVNGHTVKSNVPENAVFTDTVYDDTEVQKRISDNGYGEIAGGKNLANFSKLGAITTNGITFEYQSNGSIKVFGTVSSDGNVYTPLELTKTRFSKGCWYTTSVKSSNPNTIAKVFFTNKGDTTTLQMSETADLYYYIQFFPTGSTNNNLTAGTVIDEVLYPQIEEGTAPTDYEPYFPSNKMLAEEKANKSETTVNLLKPTLETTTKNGVTCTNNGDGTYTISGTSTAQVTFKLAVNVKVPISCILAGCKGGSPTTYMFGVFDGTNYFEVYDIDNAKEIPAKTYRYAYIVVRSGVTIPENTIITPMITTNLDATYDDFVPYTGDSGSLNGDVADIRSDVDEMNKVVFSKSITISSASTNYFLTMLGIGLYYLQAVAKLNGSTYAISHIATVAVTDGEPVIQLDDKSGPMMKFVSMQNPNIPNVDGLGIYSYGAPVTADITIIKII